MFCRRGSLSTCCRWNRQSVIKNERTLHTSAAQQLVLIRHQASMHTSGDFSLLNLIIVPQAFASWNVGLAPLNDLRFLGHSHRHSTLRSVFDCKEALFVTPLLKTEHSRILDPTHDPESEMWICLVTTTQTAILGGWTTLFEQWERKWVLVPWEFAAEPGWEF